MSSLQVDIIRNKQGNGSPEFDRGLSVIGIITSTSIEATSIGIGSTEIISSSFQLKNITSLDSTTLSTFESALELGPNTFNSLFISSGGISTFTGNVNILGITTVNSDLYVTGTLFSGLSGASLSSLSIGSTQVISSSRELQNITSLDPVTISTIESAIQQSPNIFSDLEITGISTFNGVAEFKNNIFAEQDLFVSDYFTADQVAIGTLTSTSNISNKNFGKTLNIGNDLIMFHLDNPSVIRRSNWIISDEYDLFLGTKSEGSVNFYSALIGIQTGNNANPNNTANVFLGFGTHVERKLTTTGYGVSVTGLTATNFIGIGTTDPTSKLSVEGDGNFTGIVTAASFVGDGSNLTGISTFSGDYGDLTNTPVNLSDFNNDIGFITSFTDTNYWIETSVGIHTLSNVGIGTTNPTSALTVKGNTSLEDLNVSGVSTFTSIDVENDVNVVGVISASGGFISVGNTTPIQISLVGNELTFTAVGIGSTTLILS
jgi:hypothetical protein